MKVCSIGWCEKKAIARGWCGMHWARWRKGLPMDVPPMRQKGSRKPPVIFTRAKRRSECPDREPDLIYNTTDGYRCYRWRPEHLEMLEHRYLVDAEPGFQVHHETHDRQDNDPARLSVLTHAEHRREHCKVPDDQLLKLWRCGLNCSEIGREVGLHSSQAFRRLRRLGVDTSPRRSRTIRRQHSASQIAGCDPAGPVPCGESDTRRQVVGASLKRRPDLRTS